MRCSSRERGVALMEMLVGLALVALLLVPLVQMMTGSRRIAHSAGKHLAATLHGQSLLEALGELTAAELPEADVLLADGEAPAGGTGRWARAVELFSKAPPFAMTRRVLARRLPEGAVVLTLRMEFLRLPGEAGTRRELVLRTLSRPAR
jgi:competence protein ComGC